MKAVLVHNFGGPEVLLYEEIDRPEPGEGQALVRIEAAGVNFIDVYHRMGRYPRDLPMIPGSEGAGTVEAVGPGVDDLQPGDRVAYAMEVGSYAEYALVSAWKLVPLPESVAPRLGAALTLQGLTAHYLCRDTFRLKKGDSALVHAAAGGMGLLMVQIAKSCGAWVIGTVSTEEKSRLAYEAGADEVILYTQADFEAETLRLTAGEGVDVVYDSVGKDTFDKSLNCLRPRGTLALYGQSSGPVAPIDPQILNAKGSLFLTRPSLGHYMVDRAELMQRAGDLFSWLEAGSLKVRVDQEFPLQEAAAAHRYIEGRKTKGKLLLIP